MKCHSCFASTRTLYCAKCQRELFDGIKMKPLTFDKVKFNEIRRETGERISFSGMQNKISLSLNSKGELEPTQKAGRYILKPYPSSGELFNAEDVVANEHLSMYLSEHIFKINTAKRAVIPFSDGELAYITKRFDYTVDGAKIPQEDFASILAYDKNSKGENFKFESSYEMCAKKIREIISVPIKEIEEFYKRILLNYLIGNGDAHLKNFSVMMLNNQQRVLTPNYDILYTGYHIDETFGECALDLFDEYETKSFSAMGRYTLQDFEVFGLKIGIPAKRLRQIYDAMASVTDDVELAVEKSFLSDKGKEAYLEKYHDRLKNGLLYRIDKEEYMFDSVLGTY